jgi:hypothetical protein
VQYKPRKITGWQLQARPLCRQPPAESLAPLTHIAGACSRGQGGGRASAHCGSMVLGEGETGPAGGLGRQPTAGSGTRHAPRLAPAGRWIPWGSRGYAGLAGRRAGLQPRPTQSPSANLNWCPAACPLPAVWQHRGTGGPSGWLTYARDLHRGLFGETGFKGGPAGCYSRL